MSSLTSKWATVATESEEKEESKSIDDVAREVKPSAVSEAASKWDSKDETEDTPRSIETTPRSNTAVSALTSMWTEKSTMPTKEELEKSKIETPKGIVTSVSAKWSENVSEEKEVPRTDSIPEVSKGSVSAITSKWAESVTEKDVIRSEPSVKSTEQGAVSALESKLTTGQDSAVEAEEYTKSITPIVPDDEERLVPKDSVLGVASKWSNDEQLESPVPAPTSTLEKVSDISVVEREANHETAENVTSGSVSALTSKWATVATESKEKENSKSAGDTTGEVKSGTVSEAASKWDTKDETEDIDRSIDTTPRSNAAVSALTSMWTEKSTTPVQEEPRKSKIETPKGIVTSVSAKWTENVFEEKEVPRTDSIPEVSKGSVSTITSKWAETVAEKEVTRSEPAVESTGRGAVSALKSKWMNRPNGIDEVEEGTQSITPAGPNDTEGLASKGSVAALASKWVDKKQAENNIPAPTVTLEKASDAAVLKQKVAHETAENITSGSVSALISKSGTATMENEEEESKHTENVAREIKSGTVSETASKLSMKGETEDATEPIESTPRLNTAVSALTSMWTEKSTTSDVEEPKKSKIETPKGIVTSVSAKWTENVPEEKEFPRTDSIPEVSKCSVSAITSKWAETVAEKEVTRSEPSVESNERGAVSQLKAKWMNGPSSIDEVKEDTKPITPVVPDDEEGLASKGSVAALASKWGDEKQAENNIPAPTVTLEKASDAAVVKPKANHEEKLQIVPVDVDDDLTGEGFIDVTEKPIEYQDSSDVDILGNGSTTDLQSTKEESKPFANRKSLVRTKLKRQGAESIIGTGDYAAEYGTVVQDEMEEEEEEVEILERNLTQPEYEGSFEEEEEVTVVERNEMRESFLDEKVTVIDRNEMRKSFLDEKEIVTNSNMVDDSFLEEKVTIIERNEMRESFLDEKVTVVDRNEMGDFLGEKDDDKEQLIIPVKSSVVSEFDESRSRITIGGASWMAQESAVELDPSSRVETNTRHRAEVGDLEIVEAIEVEEEVAIDEDYVRRRSSVELRRSLQSLPKDRGSKKINARNKLQFLQRRTGKTKSSFNAPMVLDATDSMKVAEGKPSFVAPPTVDIGVVTPRGSTNEIGQTSAKGFVRNVTLTEHTAMSHEAFTASGVGVLCAMVNAPGEEKENEWVAVANYSSAPVNLDGWALSDTKRRPLRIGGRLRPGESVRVVNMQNDVTGGAVELPNRQGSIMLLAPDGGVADSVTYIRTRERGIKEGIPFVFHFSEPLGVSDATHSRDLNAGVGVVAACFAKAGGWVSIANFSRDKLALPGWSLQVGTKKPLMLDGTLEMGETLRVERAANAEIEDEGDIVLRGPTSEVVDKVSFGRGRSVKIVEGMPVIFHPTI